MPHRLFIAALACLLACGCSRPDDDPTPDVGDVVDVGAVDAAQDTTTDPPDAADVVDATDTQDGCNPLAPRGECMLPYPSDFFRTSGVVDLGVAAPRDKTNTPVPVLQNIEADGFGILPSIIFDLGTTLDPDSLVPWDAPEVSLTAASSTLLLEATTLEPVPHYSEVYVGSRESVRHRLGAIRPLVRLKEGTRYIVAVQGTTSDGAVVPPTDGFAKLLASELPVLARYGDDVLAPLTEFGVDRDALQLAWDFTTRTEQNVSGDMFAVRDGTQAWLDDNTPTVVIIDVIEDPRPTTARQIEGTFTAPQWVVANEPGTVLAGAHGDRQVVGTIEVPFTITIPRSIADGVVEPGAFLQFGHGFFGTREEVVSEVMSDTGEELGVVLGAIDWHGMSRADRDWLLPQLISDPAQAFAFAPRVHQAMANQLVFTHVIRTALSTEAALQIDGAPAYDPARVHFLGISQGHILGGTFAALTPTIDRFILHAGGAALSYTLTRSFAFVAFELLLAQPFDHRELLKFEALAPLALEPIDPITYAPYVLAHNAVERRILMQGGVGDTAVPTTSLELHARALGVPLVTPAPIGVPFLEEVPSPAPSGLTLFDLGEDQLRTRYWQTVNYNSPIHEDVRRLPKVRAQMRSFLRDGVVENPCDGACVVSE